MTAINVNALLREALSDLTSSAQVVTKRPADLLERLPLVFARHITGSGLDPRWASYASIAVDAYTSMEVDPFSLAKQAHDALRKAHEEQTVFDSGWIAHFEVLMPPWDNHDPVEASVVNRSTAEYRLLLRNHP